LCCENTTPSYSLKAVSGINTKVAKRQYLPKTRLEFWEQKFARNVARDQKVLHQLSVGLAGSHRLGVRIEEENKGGNLAALGHMVV